MKKLLTLFLLLSPSLLLAKQDSVKAQLRQAQDDIAMLEEEVIRLNEHKKQLGKIAKDINSLKYSVSKPKKEKKTGFFVTWIYRPIVFIASICTIVLTAGILYFYIRPYNALTRLGLSGEVLERVGFEQPAEDEENQNNHRHEISSNRYSNSGRGGRGRGSRNILSSLMSKYSSPQDNQDNDFNDYL